MPVAVGKMHEQVCVVFERWDVVAVSGYGYRCCFGTKDGSVFSPEHIDSTFTLFDKLNNSLC